MSIEPFIFSAEGPGADFIQPSAAELSISFPDGSVDGETDCFNITIIDDNELEGLEEFTVSLTDPLIGGSSDGVSLGVPSSSPVEITDNEGTFFPL